MKKLIAGLEGIYIKTFEFKKANVWSKATCELKGFVSDSALPADARLRMAGDATVNLAGYTGAAHDNAAVNSWMQTRNNIGGTPTISASQFDADSFYGQAASCPLQN